MTGRHRPTKNTFTVQFDDLSLLLGKEKEKKDQSKF